MTTEPAQEPGGIARVRELRSIDIVMAEVRDQMATQLRHFERLDTHAGVLLGFAGLFVALAPESSTLWIASARVAGVASAIGALATLRARSYPVLDLIRLRMQLTTDRDVLQLTLLDTHIVFVEEARRRTNEKAMRLRMTITALFLAIALAVVGLLVDN